MAALRTVTFDEPSAISDFLKFETAQEYCRDDAVIVSGAGVLKKGTVLGKITASKKFTSCSPDATDGSQTAVAVLLEDVDATSADKQVVILARGPAVVARLGLVWHANLNTTNERDAAALQLAAVGILVRATA